MKVLITGTHFTPAQAVIEELKKDESVKIVYVGRKTTIEGDRSRSNESRVLPELGVKFISLTAGRFSRYITFWSIISILKIPFGFIQSFFILVSEKPDVVLSFGGYVGLPVVVNAWLLNIPVILHEQTLVSGISNTIAGLFANKIAVSFDKNFEFDKKKTIYTGNPMREDVVNIIDDKVSLDIKKIVELGKRKKLPIILVTGGNQGSHIINETFGKNLEQFLELAVIVHQTGESKYKDFEKYSEKANEKYLVKKWIDSLDWGYLLKNTDLAISRSGANTLIEFAYFSVPAIIIPIPFSNRNEQEKNAEYFSELGLVQKISQIGLTSEKLLKLVKECVLNLKLLKEKAKNAKSVVIIDASRRLALETKILGENEY